MEPKHRGEYDEDHDSPLTILREKLMDEYHLPRHARNMEAR